MKNITDIIERLEKCETEVNILHRKVQEHERLLEWIITRHTDRIDNLRDAVLTNMQNAVRLKMNRARRLGKKGKKPNHA